MNKEQIIADMAEAMEYAIGYKFERLNLCAQAAYNASPLAHVGELVEALEFVKCDMYDSKPLGKDVCNRVEQALSRFKDWKTTPAPVSVEGWQPIESAPKDGTQIDLWASDARWVDCSWTGAYWFSPHGIYSCGAEMEHHGYIPTHWMNLPKPPQTEGNKS